MTGPDKRSVGRPKGEDRVSQHWRLRASIDAKIEAIRRGRERTLHRPVTKTEVVEDAVRLLAAHELGPDGGPPSSTHSRHS